MNVLKLHVTYDGYHGGHADEILLLPADINGVLFEKLSEGKHDEEVWLGELEGKHSECYGDLSAEVIDIDTLPAQKRNHYIERSHFGSFESYFEERESDFVYDKNYDKNKVARTMRHYAPNEEPYIKTSIVHRVFVEQLRHTYVQEMKEISVSESDYDVAMRVLRDAGIQTYPQ